MARPLLGYLSESITTACFALAERTLVGYSSKILNNSVGSLIAQQAAIAVTSNNIANVHTPGYARRTIEFETRSGGKESGTLSVGNGVQANQVTRVVDSFVDRMLREATGENSGYAVENEFYNRLQAMFALDESAPTIGSTLTEFYNAANGLAGDPSSLELRANLIERGKDLVEAIKSAYATVADLQTEADNRIVTEIDEVNVIAGQIAKLNSEISAREATGNVAADERDQREELLKDLAGKIQYTLLEDSDGQVNIFIGKGFALVSGSTARSLETTATPSFAAGAIPPSLDGQALHYIVFDYDSGAGTSHIDLTQALQSGSGSIGALLKLRGYNDPANTSAFSARGTLVDVASRIEAITRTLLTSVNTTYLGATDEDSGAAGFQPSSGDLDGNVPSVFGLFDFTYAGVKDSDGDGLPSSADLLATGIDCFTGILSFKPTDPRTIAAAVDADTTEGATVFPAGDGRNILALAATLRSTSLSFSQGSFSMTGSFDQAYNQTLTYVSALKSRAESNERVSEANLLSAQQRRDAVSGVSLDEEFTALIRFQKSFQASARMIKVADDLLSQIVQLI